ncbi:MAG: rhomboid family intramembrane serine protease [Bacteroidota bacterium]|nr:rhomboid family intramembrane serine protease [Bacteroidota bacterium]MCA6442443.1 rhomboid family intramembrane serine protease [Bacteroidota bacterium]
MKNYLRKKIVYVAKWPLLFLSICWILFFLNQYYQLNYYKYGVLPRDLEGIKGVFSSVFIHGDLEHITSNSLPILVLGMLLFDFYKKIAKQAFIWIWIISGIWLWIGGRNSSENPNYHIGASTLIYGLSSFLFFSGILRKHKRLMVISALVVFLYGSITHGIFPIQQGISWEGHLFGAISGALVAYNYRKEGPRSSGYYWPKEEEEETTDNYWEENHTENLKEENNPTIKITYQYKEKEND